MKYYKTRNYKYCVYEDEHHSLNSLPLFIREQLPIKHHYFQIHQVGMKYVLTVRKGYRWDGSSGPIIDTKNTMTASLIHDALAQALRNQLFGILHHDDGTASSTHKMLVKWSDEEYWHALRKNGMSRFRAGYNYYGLRSLAAFGSPYASPKNAFKIKVEVA